MEEAFERVEIQQDSDSEDEDSPVHRQILLQPKVNINSNISIAFNNPF